MNTGSKRQMASEADYCGEAKQRNFGGFPSDYVNIYLLGTECVDKHILRK